MLRSLIVASTLSGSALVSTAALAGPLSPQAAVGAEGCQTTVAGELRLRSGLWRNLHHLLYAQAGATRPPAAGRIPILAEDRAVTLSPGEQAVWNDALAVYVPLTQRDLLFDEDLVRIGRSLSSAGDDLSASDVPVDLRRALVAARPIYERRFLQRHQQINDDWCAALRRRLKMHGPGALDRLREIYGAEAPGFEPVEVTVYANWAGAYTSLDPVEIVIASGHPGNQGDASLEIVIHEISHTLAGPLRTRLRDASERLSSATGANAVPDDLWHQALFYIAGEIVSELIPGYVAYADRNGLWSRVWPDPARALLAEHLDPVLDGHDSLDSAIEQLVSDWVRPRRPDEPE